MSRTRMKQVKPSFFTLQCKHKRVSVWGQPVCPRPESACNAGASCVRVRCVLEHDAEAIKEFCTGWYALHLKFKRANSSELASATTAGRWTGHLISLQHTVDLLNCSFLMFETVIVNRQPPPNFFKEQSHLPTERPIDFFNAIGVEEHDTSVYI